MQDKVTELMRAVEAPPARISLVGTDNHVGMLLVPIYRESIKGVGTERHHEDEYAMAFEKANYVVDRPDGNVPCRPDKRRRVFNHLIGYQQGVTRNLDVKRLIFRKIERIVEV